MSSPFVGEIRMFGGSFAPAGWAFCQGQLIPISENDTLFNLIGTTYGGDGQSTFALPDLSGRVPMHVGGTHILGEAAGTETVTLTVSQIPAHSHSVLCNANNGTQSTPVNNFFAGAGVQLYVDSSVANPQNMNSGIVQPDGGSQPHENMAPFLVISFIISLFGIFPSQN
jgi:microcystin-dependent protein